MQFQNEQCKKKQIEKYDEQLKFVSSVQSKNLIRHVHFLTLFLPEQFLKRGVDQRLYTCSLAYTSFNI
ncbi:unnamed protein product [Rotaria sp. Silwood1]|nr:unnamed protein product [Rotaria sp. Silwood1]